MVQGENTVVVHEAGTVERPRLLSALAGRIGMKPDAAQANQIGVKLLAEAERIALDVVEWRRSFHQFPELGLEEHMTSSKIEGLLSSMPEMEVIKGFGLPTCVIGRIGGDLPAGAP
jgi:hypothetical protein